jgi:hypothetical protein
VTWVEFADKHFVGLAIVVVLVAWAVCQVLQVWLLYRK